MKGGVLLKKIYGYPLNIINEKFKIVLIVLYFNTSLISSMMILNLNLENQYSIKKKNNWNVVEEGE